MGVYKHLWSVYDRDKKIFLDKIEGINEIEALTKAESQYPEIKNFVVQLGDRDPFQNKEEQK